MFFFYLTTNPEFSHIVVSRMKYRKKPAMFDLFPTKNYFG